MRALSKAIRMEEIVDKRIKKRKQEVQTRRNEKAKAKRKHQAKSLEFGLLQKKYPDSKFVVLVVKDVHPDLKIRFQRKCKDEGFTMSGKSRRLALNVMSGKINDAEMQQALGGFDPVAGFGRFPRNACTMMTMSYFPEKVHNKFLAWCRVRGVRASWKMKQLMVAYIKGYVK
jgi:hypothetical protein